MRQPSLQGGTVATATGYIGSDTGTSPGHSQITYVSGVTLPTFGTETTAEKVEMDYIARKFGGDE